MAAAGLARTSSSMTAWRLASSCSLVKETLPTRTWTLPDLVGAVLDPAALELGHGLADVGGDRAGLGVGHEAPGPEDPAELAHLAHEVGGGDGHVEVEEPAFDLGHEVVGADLVGAGRPGLGGRSPAAKTTTRAVRPVPGGRLRVPRTIWSALRGSTPRRTASSTVSSNLAVAMSLTRSTASTGGYSCSRSNCSRAAWYFLPLCTSVPLGRLGADVGSASDGDAHGAGRARHLALGRLDVVGVQVGQLHRGDLGRPGRR